MALKNRRDYAAACETIANAIAELDELDDSSLDHAELMTELQQLRRDLADMMPPLYRNVLAAGREASRR